MYKLQFILKAIFALYIVTIFNLFCEAIFFVSKIKMFRVLHLNERENFFCFQ